MAAPISYAVGCSKLSGYFYLSIHFIGVEMFHQFYCLLTSIGLNYLNLCFGTSVERWPFLYPTTSLFPPPGARPRIFGGGPLWIGYHLARGNLRTSWVYRCSCPHR